MRRASISSARGKRLFVRLLRSAKSDADKISLSNTIPRDRSRGAGLIFPDRKSTTCLREKTKIILPIVGTDRATSCVSRERTGHKPHQTGDMKMAKTESQTDRMDDFWNSI